ncbi:hypothetical protein SO802_008655 [Lithocarpus litseifolius]|uniref:RNase H type-1 domain-containing protein n=1 Tax=Lithocarpus litseifolius TaxID=425828 RepID=A0AAW2DBU9_9ROSI
MNGLPTAENLKKRGINTSELCPCCEKEPKSITHSLLRCEVAKKVWECWRECLVDIPSSQRDFSDLALEILVQGTAMDLETFFVTAGNDQPYESSRWHAPPAGVFKINVDGATSENGRNSSVGVIIRDSNGMTVVSCSNYLSGQFTALETEALAVECGILLAREMELAQVIIETDALSVVQSITTGETEGGIGHSYLGIIGLLNTLRSWKLKHLKRDYNRIAHELAQIAKRNEASQCWRGVSPPMVQHLIQEDRI